MKGVNKIRGWNKVNNVLPIPEQLVIIKEKKPTYDYLLATLTVDSAGKIFFLGWGENERSITLVDADLWAYIDLGKGEEKLE